MEDAGDEACAYVGVVVSQNAEALGAGEGLDSLGAVVDGFFGEEARGAVGDEVTGDEDQVGGDLVDLLDDVVEVEGLGVLVEVDVGELDDAEAVEGLGEVAQDHGEMGDLEVVAGVLARVEGEGGCGEAGNFQEAAAGEVRGVLGLVWVQVGGCLGMHRSF